VFPVLCCPCILGANVSACCAFLSCSYALLLHLPEVLNEQINVGDDDDKR